MSIPTLLVACLLSDPGSVDTASILGASDLGRAGVRAFESSLLANAGPLAAAKPSPYAADDKGASLLSYTYAEVGFARTEVDVLDDHADSLYAKGSFNFLRFFNVVAGVERAETNFDNATVDSYFVGGGAHFGILPQLDAVGEATWNYAKFDSDSFSSDTDTGYSLYLGGRWLALPFESGGIEIDGGYRYNHVDSMASDNVTNAWEVGARVHFLKFLSVGATYAFIDDDRRLAANVRFSF